VHSRAWTKIAKTTPCKVEWTPARNTLAALRPGQEKKGPQPNLIPPWPRAGSGCPALRLRTLQTMADIPVGKNSTIICGRPRRQIEDRLYEAN